MQGFKQELLHPSHVTTWNIVLILDPKQSRQNPIIMLVKKKGNQQMMKIPITAPRVFAAFFSLLNFANFRDKLKPWVPAEIKKVFLPLAPL